MYLIHISSHSRIFNGDYQSIKDSTDPQRTSGVSRHHGLTEIKKRVMYPNNGAATAGGTFAAALGYRNIGLPS